jgi:hypothetical protein
LAPLSAPPFASQFARTPAPRGERWAVGAILLVYLAVQANNLRHNVFIGQDNYFHFQSSRQMLAHPGQWFRMDLTNRPLLYWVGAACLRLTHQPDSFWLPAAIFVILSAVALWLLHDSMRSFMRSPALRVGALAGIAFLPVTVITCVVYAADTVAMLPFVLAGWSLIRSAEAISPRHTTGYALAAGGALCLGDLAKFTFIVLPAAVLFVILIWWRRGRFSGRRALIVAGLAAVLPAGFSAGIYEMNQVQTGGMSQHALIWPGTGELTWRELLVPKRTDRRVFAAPIYWQHRMVDGKMVFPLLEHHGFTYPALLHLAIFTDMLNFGIHGYDLNSVTRPEPQQTMARWAVAIGLLFSVPTVAAILGFWAWTLWSLICPRSGPSAGPLVWGVFATAWYLPLVLTLPFVVGAYDFGYWLPRLVLPALWGFALLLFDAIDRLAQGGRSWLAVTVTGLLLIQAAIHIRSVWY